MMKKIFSLAIIAFTALTMLSCAQSNPEVDVTTEKLHEVVENTPDNTIIIDVRTPGEVAEGTVDGAAVIDYNGDQFESKVAQLDKDKTYYVYCKSGGRSARAVSYMQEQGFKNVYNVVGGYDAYKAAGYTD